MAKSFTGRKRIRKSFGRIPEVAPMPNLIEVQKSSYDHFLQMDVPPEQRASVGLQEVFKSVFPIRDFSERARLEFVRYELEQPKYDVEECQQRGITFAAPLKVTLRLVVWDVDEDTGARSIRDIKEQDVYMGDMPLMTKNGTFIINGTERVIVSQMHRSPGVFFDHDKGKTPFLGQISVRRPRHPLSRLLARFRVRRQGPSLCPHRPPPQAAGDDAALRARRRRDREAARQARRRRQDAAAARGAGHVEGRDPRLLLRHRPSSRARQERLEGAVRSRRASAASSSIARSGRRQDRQGHGRGRREDDAALGAQARRGGPEGNPGRPRTSWSATISPSTSSTRRPARSMPRPATS